MLNAAVPLTIHASVVFPHAGTPWMHVTGLEPSLKTRPVGAVGAEKRKFPTGGAP